MQSGRRNGDRTEIEWRGFDLCSRRAGHAATLFAAALFACALPAWAQPYPSKPVRYIVPFPPGGTPDIIARVLAERLTKIWGQQVIVENRAGGGGTLGALYASKMPADGYTLFQCNAASSAIGESLYAKPGYDHRRDFAGITRIGRTPNVLVVHPSMPVRTVKEFIAYAKAHPGRLIYATSGVGTSQHLSMEFLKLTTKIDVIHVPYKGAAQALSELIGGQIPVSMQSAPALIPAVKGGRVRALGVTSKNRVPQLSDVPTMDETALPGFEVSSWWGTCTPSGTPASVLDKVQADLHAVLRTRDVQQRFHEIVIEIAPSTGAEFDQFMRAEHQRWARVIKDAGIPQQ
jgi:tripartite-type tricarboxylate transporter receptor subunit TctC